jgi:hypothetical protein
MASESSAHTESDPLKAVADAMDAAVKAAREGAEDAKAAAADMLPVAGDFLSRVTYKTCYALSYGVVFPTMMIARSIPKNNAAVHGFIDGAQAAKDLIEEMKSKASS